MSKTFCKFGSFCDFPKFLFLTYLHVIGIARYIWLVQCKSILARDFLWYIDIGFHIFRSSTYCLLYPTVLRWKTKHVKSFMQPFPPYAGDTRKRATIFDSHEFPSNQISENRFKQRIVKFLIDNFKPSSCKRRLHKLS